MILAIDTSTSACTAALFDEQGRCIGARDEAIGRGHAERLAPMLSDLLEGRSANTILVGVGPGSFTGIRVGIAAANGLSIGWDAALFGMSSLALLAASAETGTPVAAAMIGGHGELFVQQFGANLEKPGEILNLPPQSAAKAINAELVVGPAAQTLVEARGHGRAIDALPSASFAMALPQVLRSLAPAPVYARAPDAKVKSAA